MPFNFLNQGKTDSDATKFTPIDTFIDPVSKIRVSNPGNLIDTDFEYGLQPTKWETVEIINNTPAFFSKSGDTTISDITGITTNGGTREITVTTAFPHNLDVGIPIRVAGTKVVTADGSYIINATPTPTTFTYLSRANVAETISIFDLYSSIITGEFFQGSQISISDSEGIITDGAGPQSTLTVKTSNKHGFGPKTPFYFLNLNSTVSKEFESQNSTSLSFDPTNSATAQAFDGSNTLLQTPIDLSNSATTLENTDNITSTNAQDSTVTVSIATENQTAWSELALGSPLYYDVNIGAGFFQANPRGVVFIKNTDLVDATNGTATFQVSELPDGEAIPILANMTGYFQIADQARTFAGNNVNPATQIDIQVLEGPSYTFDGGNQGFDGENPDPPSNVGTVVGYTGTSMTLFSSEGNLDYYVGAMLLYETDGTPAAGLANNTTYFVTAFAEGQSAGLFTMSISELPGEESQDINISGGSGTQTFSKIGVSVDKDIVHVRDSGFEEGDMLEYVYPNNGTPGNFGADFEQNFYFVGTVYDTHNYILKQDAAYTPITATGGDIVTVSFEEGIVYRLHQFRNPGTSTFSVTDPGEDGKIEFLLVGGGGAGGFNGGGGGGGGAVILAETEVSVQDYSITVGAGGAKRNSNDGYSQTASRGGVGGSTSGFGVTATGGGGGGVYQNISGSDGGNGGGGGDGSGAGGTGTAPTLPAGVTGTVYAGNNGAQAVGGGHRGGGGGGAGGAGNGITGGPGVPIDILGTTYYFGGGGGAGAWSYAAGNGGIGGAGGGGSNSSTAGSGGGSALNNGASGRTGQDRSDSGGNAGANTGGGGGGATFYSSRGVRAGNGGSGIAVIKYQLTDPNSGNFITASGGEVTTAIEDGILYAVHSFKNVGTSTFEILTEANQPSNNQVEFLVVGGGGAGGFNGGGGGGGGAVILAETNTLTAQSYTVVVGSGGAKRNSSDSYSQTVSRGGVGGSSSVFGVTATGGGGGGVYANISGSNGANGGGGGDASGAGGTGTAPTLPAGITGTVYAGNNGSQALGGGHRGGPGAGAGGVGSGLNGGPGVPIDILGTTYYFGGGGGAGTWEYTAGNGGIGGGGGGGSNSRTAGSGGGSALNSGSSGRTGTSRSDSGGNAGANTGGGGGGATFYSNRSPGARAGNGGSGFVAIRYPIGIVG